MASFDQHSRCARCRDKGHGNDACVKKLPCEFCELLTPEQVLQLSSPTYKLRKDRKQERESLVDLSSVTVLSSVDQEKSVGASSSLNKSEYLSLPQPSFRKDLQELDQKWSLHMARLEALISMGQRPRHVSFSPVKAPVTHGPPAGSLSQAPFMLSTVPSGQAGSASGPDRTSVTTTVTSVGMTSLENLYPDLDVDSTEPVFSQPGPVSYGDSSSHSLPVSSASYLPPEPAEEGEVSDPEEQPDVGAGDSDRVLSDEQNYRETVRGVRAFMGWSHIPDLEYSPASKTDNPRVGHRAQPVGKVSVVLPPEDWLCRKLETLNLVLIEGYPTLSLVSPVDFMATNLRPQCSKQIFERKNIQNGTPRDNSDFLATRGMGDIAGFQRVPLPKSVLSVPGPSLWLLHSSDGVHLCGQRGQVNGSVPGYKDPPVPRRLVDSSPYQRILPPGHPIPPCSLSGCWVGW